MLQLVLYSQSEDNLHFEGKVPEEKYVTICYDLVVYANEQMHTI